MNILLECEATLSKKLEHLCDRGENITLHITGVNGNKGRALVRLTSSNPNALKEALAVGETSLMLKVAMVEEDIPTPGEGVVGNFFSGGDLNSAGAVEKEVGQVSPEGKMPTRASSQVKPHADKPRASAPAVERPAPQVEVLRVGQAMVEEKGGQPARTRTVMDLESLDEALGKVADIDKETNINLPPGAKLDRSTAIKVEMSVPRMREKCFIRNNHKSMLVIDDIEVTQGQSLAVLPGQVVELSRFPARKIRDSSNLRWCVERNFVSFVTYEEYLESFKKLAAAKNRADQSPLPIYDSRDSALGATRSAFADSDDTRQNAAEILMTDEKVVPYEDDQMMDKIVGAMPRG
jgi:hypothetical protein